MMRDWLKRLAVALFGVCTVEGHQWTFVPPTPEEAAIDKEAYDEWFQNYPIGPDYEPHGHTECSVCGKVKAPQGSAGRPSGYHPGWG